MSDDLRAGPVAQVLGDRAVRAYPALLSTEASAMAWARDAAPDGAVIVADYQASPRGRGGLPWTVAPGRGLGFSVVLRPALAPQREGWPYVAASLALADVIGPRTRLRWPDAVVGADQDRPLAQLGVHVELGPARTEWITITVLVEDATPPRAPLLARLVRAIEERLAQPGPTVLAVYRPHCATLGHHTRALLIPMGPGGLAVEGEAVDVLDDGALVLLTVRGSRVAVLPQNLGLLGPPAEAVHPPERILGRWTR